MTAICILGSTGSIGRSVLDVVARHPAFKVDALVANTRWEILLRQVREFHPRVAVLADPRAAEKLAAAVKAESLDVVVTAGTDAVNDVASDARSEVVVAGMVGAAGLGSALSAARAGKRLLLANKEPLVMCGGLIKKEASQAGAVLLPLDSEHNAIFQSLPWDVQQGKVRAADAGVTSLVLTGSGGPFRGLSANQLAEVTCSQALAHPNWSMGPKITIDSATLMNKGLEVIEACHLFDMSPESVEVVIHPESVIHSMVRYRDGSVVAQMGSPDMRIPIAHALAWPQRISSGAEAVDFLELRQLRFEPPDTVTFPCLELARDAFQQGGTATTVLNAANEIAVDYFLQERVAFTQIPSVIETTLAQCERQSADDLETILQADRQAREIAHRIASGKTTPV